MRWTGANACATQAAPIDDYPSAHDEAMNSGTFEPASGAEVHVCMDVRFALRPRRDYAEQAAGVGLRPHVVDKPRFSGILAGRDHRFTAQAFIFRLGYRNSVAVAEIVKAETVRFPSGERGKRGN
jgi:hypothetical protein